MLANTHVVAAPSDNLSMDPAHVKTHFERIGRFRVLVIGRANAGKTTLLQRVCNTTDLPEVFDAKGNKVRDVILLDQILRGYHNIEHELVFRSNPGFIFHDSCGFETGSVKELEEMRAFVTGRSITTKLENRIHAIWYCIPANDHMRLITAAEEKFFNECDTQTVPVIALLTKANALNRVAIGELREAGLNMGLAIQSAGEREKQLLEKLEKGMIKRLEACKFPPRSHLSLAKMHEENFDCTDLLTVTANALDEEALQMLLISTQQVNLLLNIKWAVK
ncbi:hypothetical protein ID866_7387 [Astraeus odoratus]|nr:hypothetical protein ID866_7387 [Astraeus odoratus]